MLIDLDAIIRYRTASGSDRPWVRRRPACFLCERCASEIKQAGRLRTQGPVATARGSVTVFLVFQMSFFITTQFLDRKEANRRINLLTGKDLRTLADEY